MCRVKVASLVVLALLLGACIAGPVSERQGAKASAAPLASRQPQVQVCGTENEIESSLETFARAVNEGNRVKVEAVVSSAAEWFAITTPNGHEAANGHAKIVDHLLAMHAAGDRFITPPTPNQVTLVAWDGAGHFGVAPFTFERGGKRLQLIGKGALFCGGRSQGVKVLSLGVPD